MEDITNELQDNDGVIPIKDEIITVEDKERIIEEDGAISAHSGTSSKKS